MSRLNVLIVDDEEELATTIAERLHLRDILAETAGDGETALKMIEANPPDVIVLEVMLPGIGSAEVIQQLKVLNLHIPVILLTSYGSNVNDLIGIGGDVFDYIVKPCDLNSLVNKIIEAAEEYK